jgi:hypothetical protein
MLGATLTPKELNCLMDRVVVGFGVGIDLKIVIVCHVISLQDVVAFEPTPCVFAHTDY